MQENGEFEVNFDFASGGRPNPAYSTAYGYIFAFSQKNHPAGAISLAA
jgi:hypothetical protein